MNRVKGDIWVFREAFLVIPTNLEGVCGRGLAKQMIDKFPGVGQSLRTEGRTGHLATMWEQTTTLQFFTPEAYYVRDASSTIEVPCYRLVPFPVKRSWKDESDLSMIEASCAKLVMLLKQVNHPFYCIMPQVGCGFGELKPADVMPRVDEWMRSVESRVLLIEPDPEVFKQYARSFQPGWREDRSAVQANLPSETSSDLPQSPKHMGNVMKTYTTCEVPACWCHNV